MAARNARLKLTPGGLGSEIEIDGQRIPHVRDISLTTRVLEEMPSLTLGFIVREVEIEGEMVVTVPDKTRDALIALGWTPPPGDDAITDQGVIDVDPAPLIAYNEARRKS